MQRNSANSITVHKVQPGEGRVGCDPRGVQVFYKESTIIGGRPNFVYLGDLLKKHGLLVKEGSEVADTPLRYLCVSKPDGVLTRDEVLELLAADPEINVSNVTLPEGNCGS